MCVCFCFCVIVPQVVLQALLFFGVFSSEWRKLTNISEFEIVLSIIFACLNSITQTIKLYLEAKACNERLISYCLNMVMARIGWLPFESDLLALSRGKKDSNSATETSCVKINYSISYKVFVFKNKVDYLFSSVTLRFMFFFSFARVTVLFYTHCSCGGVFFCFGFFCLFVLSPARVLTWSLTKNKKTAKKTRIYNKIVKQKKNETCMQKNTCGT